MLEIICWLWKPPAEYRSQFSVEHVNILRRMIARNYPHPHRLSCITDQKEGFDSEIRVIPLWSDHGKRESVYGPNTPSCYRRLRAFSPEMSGIIGHRFVSIDLDVVITGDLSLVWNRPENFIIWGDDMRKTPYNGSMWMMNVGARSKVWVEFEKNPERAIQYANQAGFYGSDQAWMCYVLGPGEPRWTVKDGVFSYRMHVKNNGGKMPEGAKIVFFEGHYDPWSPVIRKSCPWVEEYYK